MVRDDPHFDWIGAYLDGKKVPFARSGMWQLVHKISEKTCQSCYPYPFESVTVYICEQITGENIGQRAIMKVRTEIPGTDFPHPDPKKRGPIAEDVNETTASEIHCLETLTKAGCTSTPRLLDHVRLTQNGKMWLPGGYIVFILMELVPGISLENFWVLPREERDQVRAAFRLALEEVWRLSRFDPADELPQNLIWHREGQKCYIVDFEMVDDYREDPKKELVFSDNYLVFWCLARDDVATGVLRL